MSSASGTRHTALLPIRQPHELQCMQVNRTNMGRQQTALNTSYTSTLLTAPSQLHGKHEALPSKASRAMW